MRCKKPYSLEKRKLKGVSVYYYRFYDENGLRSHRSTGQTTAAKAHEYVINKMNTIGLVSAKKEKELIASGKINRKTVTFRDFTEDFFVWGKCEYILDRNTFGGKSISKNHAYTERGYIKNRIQPYFKNTLMSDISTEDIKNYVISMRKKAEITDGSINHIIKIVKIIFSEAVRRKVLTEDPTKGISYIPVNQKDRGILTIEEVHKLFNYETMMEIWGCETTYIFNLFAVLTGCRRGEILGLLNKYVHNEYAEIKHSWNRISGLTPTKTKETRIVPLPAGLSKLLNEIKGFDPDGFIFSFDNGEKPYPGYQILNSLYEALDNIGISEDERKNRNITFHSFRHFFNTYCRANNVTDDKVRAVTGHKTQAMVDNYTHFNVDDYKEIAEIQKKIENQE